MIGKTKLRGPVKRHGGKHYLGKRIVSLFPKHRVYCEPFCGGAAVLLNKWRSAVEIAGDINLALIGFLTVLRDQPDELIRRLRAIPYDRRSFDWACETSGDHDLIESAERFMVKNRFSRGGLGRNFAWSERLRGGEPGDSHGWQTILAELPKIAARLQGVELHCTDAVDLIRRFDGPVTLNYIDPTYPAATRTAKKAYAHEMTDEDHLRLLDAILNVRGMVVLSGYHNAIYDDALRSWECSEVKMPNHSAQTKVKSRRVEVIWLNPACDRFGLRG
jgi:DNA adenine methylase